MPARRIGLVVHPSRDVSGPRTVVEAWAAAHRAELVPLGRSAPAGSAPEPVAPHGCDVVVAIGGDGTVLGGIRVAAPEGVPVLGIACGSLGMLTALPARRAAEALDRFEAGDWHPRSLGALDVVDGEGRTSSALNDVVVVRKGAGQVKTTVRIDGELYVRLAGDGMIVATALGSSAYTLAAGGPILYPGTDAAVLTALPTHGGSAPPLVFPTSSKLELDLEPGFSGLRVEVDGQPSELGDGLVRLSHRPAHATLVAFEDAEGVLSGLRRRGIVADSPRVLAHDARMLAAAADGDHGH